LELIHYDICSPMQILSIRREIFFYFYQWFFMKKIVYPLFKKSEVLNKSKAYKILVKNKT
jgi:hypothetical protein